MVIGVNMVSVAVVGIVIEGVIESESQISEESDFVEVIVNQ